MSDSLPALRVEGFTKAFGSVLANDGIDLEIARGEIHAILGENGAGKTTLMNCIYGVYRPDRGRLFREGREVSVRSPADAMAYGIGMVHQHFMLVGRFTAAENLVLGKEPKRWGTVLDRRAAARHLREMGERYGLRVNPDTPVEDLSVGAQQKVEILKALYRGAEVLILDEPTAVLTPQEVTELGQVMRRLCSEGKSILFITHKLKEILALADRCTVIRRGKKVATLPVSATDQDRLAALMVGRSVQWHLPREPFRPGKALLEVDNLHALDWRGMPALRGVTFEVREGEILAVAGVEGNGQTELVNTLCGIQRPTQGRIRVNGRDVFPVTPRRLRAVGMNAIPEDRRRRGLVLPFSVSQNLILDRIQEEPFSHVGLIQPRSLHENALNKIGQFDIRPPDPEAPALALSGGNQQKVVIARALHGAPRVLVASQPTRGLDVGAIEFVHRALLEARDQGCAVVLVSLELDEVLELADRIIVLYEGRIQATFSREEATEELLGRAMGGAHG